MASPNISRREVLAGLGGVGAVGAVSGVGTYALLTSKKSFSGSIRSGTLSIDVDCQRCLVDGDDVSFALGGIDRGDNGTETLAISIVTNPARLWLRSGCPPAIDRLGDALVVTLRYDDVTIESGTLSAVQRSLRGGTSLGESCTTPGETAELDIEWDLPMETPDSVAGERTSFEFEFFAEQCRHLDATNGENPFVGTPPCEEFEDCLPCDGDGSDRIANATFEYDGPDKAFVELVQGTSGNSPQSSDLFAGTLDPGDTFVSSLPPSGRADVDVLVGGGTIGQFHTSCSQPFGPGLVITDGLHSLTVLEAADTAGNAICEVPNA
ncbi:SipW-dependent-type signal peptide-containing protein [Halopenitus sp. H-Gu1]|uniref:SipW-dependent-type signal peptide-containing protein n=1 Tax=Halopenitus sp. H-Gu1 TaxID=3242697 RepID=UPI00359DC945